MDIQKRLLALSLAGLQGLLMSGGQVLWKKGIDQAGGFMMPDQSVFFSMFNLFMNPVFLAGSILFGIATLLWFFLLGRFELSYIRPFLSLTLVVSVFGAWIFLGETIGMQRWLGVGLISLGMFVMVKS